MLAALVLGYAWCCDPWATHAVTDLVLLIVVEVPPGGSISGVLGLPPVDGTG
jgi:hypothetical protein